MHREILVTFDVDGDHMARSEQLADACQVEGAPPRGSSTLDDEIRFKFEDHLLVDPEVEWALPRWNAHKIRVAPRSTILLCVVVDLVELIDDLFRAGRGAARTQSAP